MQNNTQNTSSGMSLIVKTVARILAGMIMLYGIYIVAHGHLTPGGGFAGGVIIAGSFILLYLAYGATAADSNKRKWYASLCESLGIFGFWIVAILGLVFGTYFLFNIFAKGTPFHLFSAGIIPVCNVAIGVEVAGALVGIFITFAAVKLLERK